jgi:hypothetical protein
MYIEKNREWARKRDRERVRKREREIENEWESERDTYLHNDWMSWWDREC